MEIWCGSRTKKLSQWFLKTSKYSEELLSDLNNLEGWPNKVKIMQSNWIGKSSGVEINFKISNPGNLSDNFLNIFTTRADTIFGASFDICVVPPNPVTLQNKSYKGTAANDKPNIRTKIPTNNIGVNVLPFIISAYQILQRYKE